MPYLVSIVLALTLVASPLSVSAQGTDKGSGKEFDPELAPTEARQPPPREPALEPTPEEPAIEGTIEEPALQLELDDDGIEVQSATSVTAAEADSLSVELRFQVSTSSFRWSSFRSPLLMYIPSTGSRSQYFEPGIGVRFYPKGSHGVLVDADYRVDLDLDQIWGAWLRTDFGVAHVGYAYRHIIQSRRRPGRRAWTLTGHASIAAGASIASYSNADAYARQRSPVVGPRFGFDVDWHISRFFMGWMLHYEILWHTKGWLRTSQFVAFNLVPVFAIGVSIGREVIETQ